MISIKLKKKRKKVSFLCLFLHFPSTQTNNKTNLKEGKKKKKTRVPFLQLSNHIKHQKFAILIPYFRGYQDKVVVTARPSGSNTIRVHYVPSRTQSDKHNQHRTAQSTGSSEWNHGGGGVNWEAAWFPDAKLRRETKRGWGVKGKDFIFWKERKKEEMKKVQWELGWRGEREIKQTEVLTFLFCLFNLVVFVKMIWTRTIMIHE